jgi:hypothetical protein
MLEWMQSQLQDASQTITPKEFLEKAVATENKSRQKQ